jgi:hypothetical protein
MHRIERVSIAAVAILLAGGIGYCVFLLLSVAIYAMACAAAVPLALLVMVAGIIALAKERRPGQTG